MLFAYFKRKDLKVDTSSVVNQLITGQSIDDILDALAD
jgi:hypothetical protein